MLSKDDELCNSMSSASGRRGCGLGLDGGELGLRPHILAWSRIMSSGRVAMRTGVNCMDTTRGGGDEIERLL